ncbi:MAG: hypothetical protein ACM3MG_10900 [Bacillota bacterium]
MKQSITGPRNPKNPIENPDKSDPRKNIPEVDPDTRENPEIESPTYNDPPNTSDSIDKIVFAF